MSCMLKHSFVLFFLCCLMIGCEGNNMRSTEKMELSTIKDVPTSSWEKLSQRKIFFGHQSVGYNVITDIGNIMEENPQIKLNIVKTTDVKNFDAPVFAHDWIGANMDPQSKTEAFENILNNGVGEKTDIAFMKFCYVDVTAQTDIENEDGSRRAAEQLLIFLANIPQ